MKDFDMFHNLMKQSSSSVGCLISLGKKFAAECVYDLDDNILPRLDVVLRKNIQPRVRMGYGMLLWFVKQVRNLANHFNKIMYSKSTAAGRITNGMS